MANFVLLLLIFGACGNIFLNKRLEKTASFVLSLLTLVGFYFFINLPHRNFKSLPWLEYMGLNVDVSFVSTPQSKILILALLIITLLAALLTIFDKKEENKQRFVSLSLLNLAFFILLICAQNLLQLLICSCLLSVLGFCLIDDIDAKKKFAFYNLLSDMALFSVFSLVYAYVGSLNISALKRFDELGAHRDLISFLLLLALLTKTALFMFHNQLYDLSVLNFNRFSYLLSASAPLSGLIIIYKIYPLLQISDYTLPCLKVMALLSLLCGFYTTIMIDNIKEKTIGFGQMFYAFALFMLLYTSGQNVMPMFCLLIGGYIISLLFYGIYNASSFEILVSKTGGFISGLKLCFALFSIIFIADVFCTFSVLQNINIFCVTLFCALLTLAFAHVMRQIFFGSSCADERVLAMLKNPSVLLFAILAFLLFFMVETQKISFSLVLLYAALFYVFCLWLYPLHLSKKYYQNENIQQSDVFEDIFDFVIVTPLTIVGRILWLLVDFILIERTVIDFLRKMTACLVLAARKINRFSFANFLLLTILAFVLVFVAVLMRK